MHTANSMAYDTVGEETLLLHAGTLWGVGFMGLVIRQQTFYKRSISYEFLRFLCSVGVV